MILSPVLTVRNAVFFLVLYHYIRDLVLLEEHRLNKLDLIRRLAIGQPDLRSFLFLHQFLLHQHSIIDS